MIKEIEALMVHWGEQMRERGQGGGLGSQMGAIIEWGARHRVARRVLGCLAVLGAELITLPVRFRQR